jgi:HK97 family phage major capsid protein
MGVIETLEAERVDVAKSLRDLATKAEQENGGVFSDSQLGDVENRKNRFLAIGVELDRARSLVATRDEVAEFLDAAEAGKLNDSALGNPGTRVPQQRRSLGSTFVNSAQYKALLKTYPNGIPETTKGINSGPVFIPGGLKALLTGTDHTTSAGALVQPDYIGVVPYPTVQPTLRNLVTNGTTSSDRIEYAQILPYGVAGGSVNNAAGIKEATTEAAIGAGPPIVTSVEGGVKPQSAIKFKRASADVITIAHWVAATKRALSDAGQLRTLIDAFLREGVTRKIEDLILAGDKDTPTAPDNEEWDGILNTAGVQDVPFATDVPTTARKMITKVQGVGGLVTAFAMSPAVAESVDLMQDLNGAYYGNGPFALGPTTMWGVPRVTVFGMPDNVIIGGTWSTCVLWDREATTVTATDAHEDFFIRNLVAVLAEARAAFGIFNPQLMAIGHTS